MEMAAETKLLLVSDEDRNAAESTMNDQIKLLVAGATIALAGVVAGGTIVGWTRGVVKSEELRVNSRRQVSSEQ